MRAEAECKVTETAANKAATEAARTANWLAFKSNKWTRRKTERIRKTGLVVFFSWAICVRIHALYFLSRSL